MKYQDISSLIYWMKSKRFYINLSFERIAFLISISLIHNETSATSFSENQLLELFYNITELLGEESEYKLGKPNNLINEMVNQGLLLRMLGDLIEPSASYRLTSLSLSISEHYIKQKKFSSLSLSIQLTQLVKNLTDIVEAIKISGDDEEKLIKNVLSPLKYATTNLFDNIDQIQRNLDIQQDETKNKISQLIKHRWTDSIKACEKLLLNTSEALQDLQKSLEVVGSELQSHLNQIKRSIPESFNKESKEILNLLQNKLDRILTWGEEMISLWAKYDKHIHRFLRKILDIENSKRLSVLLKKSIDNFLLNPWSLTISNSDKFIEFEYIDNVVDHSPRVGIIDYNILTNTNINKNDKYERITKWFYTWIKSKNIEEFGLYNLINEYITNFIGDKKDLSFDIQKLSQLYLKHLQIKIDHREPLTPWVEIYNNIKIKSNLSILKGKEKINDERLNDSKR